MIFDTEPKNWRELQDFVWKMFQECWFQIEIWKIVDLVRWKKEIDVYVEDIWSEYKTIILIECKFRNKPINQEVIHSFRTVVSDSWANIWFIVSKQGFQKGSIDAVEKTNIKLVTLKELEEKYYKKWQKNISEENSKYSDILFPYFDYFWKPHAKWEKIDWDTKMLLDSAYYPMYYVWWPWDVMMGFPRKFPISIPVLDDNFKVINKTLIATERQYYDFIQQNRDKAVYHFQKLFGEID